MTLLDIASKILVQKYWEKEDIHPEAAIRSRQVKAALEAVEGELNAIRTEINILKARKDG